MKDYEKLKYESEDVKKENKTLKDRNEALQYLVEESQVKHFDSKESQRTKH